MQLPKWLVLLSLLSTTAYAEDLDDPILSSEHWGMQSFSQDLPSGEYLVKLYFAETFQRVTQEGQRVFSFDVNGQEFRDFDVCAKAGGLNRVYVESVPVEITDGSLQISFTAQVENPAIKAIEIIPHQSGTEAIRINAGASLAYTDSAGHIWLPDQGFDGGQVSLQSNGIRYGSVGPPPDQFVQLFLNRDVDESGTLEEDELPQALQFLVRGLDPDGSGRLGQSKVARFWDFVRNEPDAEHLRDSLLAVESATPTTVQRLREVLDAIGVIDARNASDVATVKRSTWLSYVFTVVAMMIAVISFGHLITSPPPRHKKWVQIDSTPDAMRTVTESLVLVCLLSFIDLAWTTVQSQEFHFQEMNPLGHQILLSANSLVPFKIVSVLTCITLLFFLRKYYGAQLASWWICMICTLIAFRWIVLDSAMLA